MELLLGQHQCLARSFEHNLTLSSLKTCDFSTTRNASPDFPPLVIPSQCKSSINPTVDSKRSHRKPRAKAEACVIQVHTRRSSAPLLAGAREERQLTASIPGTSRSSSLLRIDRTAAVTKQRPNCKKHGRSAPIGCPLLSSRLLQVVWQSRGLLNGPPQHNLWELAR